MPSEHSLFIILFCINCIVILTNAFPVEDDKEDKLNLQKFGDFDGISTGNKSAAILGPYAISSARQDFQKFAGLNKTAELDNATITMMDTSKHGEKDKNVHSISARKKRYVLQGTKWVTPHLTYRISKYPTGLKNKAEVDRVIARAFQVWSDVTQLTFDKKKRGRVDIDIRFEYREHGDGDPFKEPGNILAHASSPLFGGDIHFNDEIEWTINQTSGINLFQVAAHELGHSLGLGHSDNEQALMAEDTSYITFQPNFKLPKDDVEGIQYLYGSRDQPDSFGDEKLSGLPDIKDAPDLCKDSKIDTITRTRDGSTYLFKGYFYWKYVFDRIADGYPRRIADDFGGLEGNLDASLTWTNGKTYFFKGERYWKFTNREMEIGYPKLLQRGFAGIPGSLDAACLWSGNAKAYFFKGDAYWKYDSDTDPPVSKDYPLSMRLWKGIPDDIDAAFQWENNVTYFFKGDQYYKFDDNTSEVAFTNPRYPRSTAKWWFNC